MASDSFASRICMTTMGRPRAWPLTAVPSIDLSSLPTATDGLPESLRSDSKAGAASSATTCAHMPF